jgi:hypothetical protein
MRGGWPRLFLALFVACLSASIAYTIWPEPEPPASPPGPHPRPAYWFWTPESLRNDAYLEQARDLARRGPFTLVFATPRYPHTGVDFLDVDRFAPRFRRVARVLGERGIGLGLDLRFYLGLHRQLPVEEQQGVVERVDVEIDADGRGAAELPEDPVLFPAVARPAGVQLLRVYRDGEPLEPIAPSAAGIADGRLSLTLDRSRAGTTVHALVLRNYDHPDMFSKAYPDAFARVLVGYREVGLKGAALDEFAYLPLREDRWATALYYSTASAERFRKTYGDDLVDAIGRMLCGAPAPERVREAIRYHTHQRDGIVRIESIFHYLTKQMLGAEVFVGVHPTNQTRENYSDLERSLTALDWWGVPREYGQTDEYTPMAVRMGLALRAGRPIWYNMFYHPDPEAIFEEIARCARYGGRVHYHAVNDAHFGYPLERGDLLERLGGIEERLAVLDEHVTTWPELDTLVLLGWPALMLGEVDAYHRAMQFLNALWERGYRCAAVPTYEIAAGRLECVGGRAVYGGRTFARVVVYQPEYATPETVAFLKALDRRAAGFAVVGRLTTGADGQPEPFGSDLAAYATTAAALLEEPGPALGEDGVRYPGGLKVFIDRDALVRGTEIERRIEWEGKPFVFRFSGAAVVELKPGGLPRLLAPASR